MCRKYNINCLLWHIKTTGAATSSWSHSCRLHRTPFNRSLSSHVCPSGRLLQLFKFTPSKREKVSFSHLIFRKRKEMTSHSKGIIRDNLGLQGCTGFMHFWHCNVEAIIVTKFSQALYLITTIFHFLSHLYNLCSIRHKAKITGNNK